MPDQLPMYMDAEQLFTLKIPKASMMTIEEFRVSASALPNCMLLLLPHHSSRVSVACRRTLSESRY